VQLLQQILTFISWYDVQCVDTVSTPYNMHNVAWMYVQAQKTIPTREPSTCKILRDAMYYFILYKKNTCAIYNINI